MSAERERGPYLTPNRALQLERRLAAAEARLMERLDQLERKVDRVANRQVQLVKAQAGALIDVLREETKAPH